MLNAHARLKKHGKVVPPVDSARHGPPWRS